MESGAYLGLKYRFLAGPKSGITLIAQQDKPLMDGFTIRWSTDSGAAPRNDVYFAMEVSAR
jgi:hypothetical protein